MEHPKVESLIDFSGQVVLVTGSGSGLGSGIARRFAEAGADLVIHYHSSGDGARSTVKDIAGLGRRARAVSGNLADERDVNELFEEIHRHFGGLNVLINNSGIYPLAGLLEMTPTQWDEVMDTNLKSAHLCTQAAARLMIDRKTKGAVVNISSIEAHNPAPNHSHYNASKGGMLMYTRASAYELGIHGIRVNAIAPGLLWSDSLEKDWPEGVERYVNAAPLARLGYPEDVADACLFLASPAARWITGANLLVDGGVMTHQIY
jgi:NAD(P)-dependent dehydrogenase (short-subunit alcohol dehydrogenase family)